MASSENPDDLLTREQTAAALREAGLPDQSQNAGDNGDERRRPAISLFRTTCSLSPG